MRVDFNVPVKDGKVESDKWLRESLPTIEYLRKKEAKVILMSIQAEYFPDTRSSG